MRIALLVVLFGVLLTSCKKYGAAKAAFFIRPGGVSVSTVNSTQGSGSNKITDLFLYVNGQFQGAYPADHLLPVASNGERVKISLLAGIENNGIAKTRISWSFYDIIEIDTLVESGKTIERPIAFRYNPNVKFAWLENFDNTVATSIINSPVSNAQYQIAPPAESFEGRSVLVSVPSGSAGLVGQVESSGFYALPKGSSNVYLEMNYKCNQVFEVGVMGGSERKAALNINASDNWNKIYVQLADVVSRQPTYDTYKIYFRMVKAEGVDNPRLYLDNIKVIHFQ